jgi:Dor1-like family
MVVFQFKTTESHLEDLLSCVPQFTQQCQDFSRSSANIESKRRLCSLTLSRSTQILELLEIPQLMTMCVNGGHYEEALLLAAHVRRLERRHSTIPAILVSNSPAIVEFSAKNIFYSGHRQRYTSGVASNAPSAFESAQIGPSSTKVSFSGRFVEKNGSVYRS